MALQALCSKEKLADLRRFHGASRTRAGDLLGAISAVSDGESGFMTRFPSLSLDSPNTFPNILWLVLHLDNTQLCAGETGRSYAKPIERRSGASQESTIVLRQVILRLVRRLGRVWRAQGQVGRCAIASAIWP
jgi:hypothetical protein